MLMTTSRAAMTRIVSTGDHAGAPLLDLDLGADHGVEIVAGKGHLVGCGVLATGRNDDRCMTTLQSNFTKLLGMIWVVTSSLNQGEDTCLHGFPYNRPP
jgi:hypothetical protein